MSDYWKLEIKDYTVPELEDMFNLIPPYTLENIVNSDMELVQKISNDGSIDMGKKQQILSFLSKAKDKLVKAHKKDISQLKKTNVNIAEGHMVQRRDYKNHFKHGGKDPVDMHGNPKPVYNGIGKSRNLFR